MLLAPRTPGRGQSPILPSIRYRHPVGPVVVRAVGHTEVVSVRAVFQAQLLICQGRALLDSRLSPQAGRFLWFEKEIEAARQLDVAGISPLLSKAELTLLYPHVTSAPSIHAVPSRRADGFP